MGKSRAKIQHISNNSTVVKTIKGVISLSFVYMHTVKENGKKYIGQSKMSPEKRWGKNGHRYKGCMFYDAIKKYGWNNIEHEILIDNLTEEEADYYEKYYIALYQTDISEFGYNISKGGYGHPDLFGAKNPNSRPVICLETNKRWESSSLCCKEIGVNLASLQESLYKGYRCTGLHFKYVDDNSYVPLYCDPQGVMCVETGRIWNNVVECAKEKNVHKRTVARWCRGDRKPADGLTYKYCVV